MRSRTRRTTAPDPRARRIRRRQAARTHPDSRRTGTFRMIRHRCRPTADRPAVAARPALTPVTAAIAPTAAATPSATSAPPAIVAATIHATFAASFVATLVPSFGTAPRGELRAGGRDERRGGPRSGLRMFFVPPFGPALVPRFGPALVPRFGGSHTAFGLVFASVLPAGSRTDSRGARALDRDSRSGSPDGSLRPSYRPSPPRPDSKRPSLRPSPRPSLRPCTGTWAWPVSLEPCRSSPLAAATAVVPAPGSPGE